MFPQVPAIDEISDHVEHFDAFSPCQRPADKNSQRVSKLDPDVMVTNSLSGDDAGIMQFLE